MNEELTNEIVVQFTDEDLNAIKSSDLCSSNMNGEDCFLTFLPDAVRDVVGIAIEGSLDGQCLAVSQFTSDSILQKSFGHNQLTLQQLDSSQALIALVKRTVSDKVTSWAPFSQQMSPFSCTEMI